MKIDWKSKNAKLGLSLAMFWILAGAYALLCYSLNDPPIVKNGKIDCIGVDPEYRYAMLSGTASAGQTAAQLELAKYFETGYMYHCYQIEKNLAEAYFWARLAKDAKAVERISSKLTKEQLATAEKKVSEWKPAVFK